MHIGDFGVIEREVEASAGDASTEPDTFTWFGETIRIRTDISPYNLLRFERRVLNPRLQGAKAPDKQQQVWWDAMDHLEQWIDPDDFEKFDEAAEKNQAGVKEISEVLMGLYVQVAGRPTRRSSDSSAGRPTEETTEPSNERSSDTSRASKRPASTRPRKKATGTG